MEGRSRWPAGFWLGWWARAQAPGTKSGLEKEAGAVSVLKAQGACVGGSGVSGVGGTGRGLSCVWRFGLRHDHGVLELREGEKCLWEIREAERVLDHRTFTDIFCLPNPRHASQGWDPGVQGRVRLWAGCVLLRSTDFLLPEPC